MGKHDRYPDEMVEYVRQHCKECTVAEMAERVTALFGRPVSYDQMKAFYKNHKGRTIPRKGRQVHSRYPAGMEEFIRQVAPGRSKYEIADLVNEKYGDGTITPELVHVYKKNHKIRSGNDTRFKKGQVPHNKGTHPETKGRMAETQFKKGNRPHNWRPVGSERNVIGLVEIKVAEPNVWKFKHRVIWEQHNGPIPKGGLIAFKDGDPLNMDINNLMLVTRAENAQLTSLRLRSGDPDITYTGLQVIKLRNRVKAKRKEQHGKSK